MAYWWCRPRERAAIAGRRGPSIRLTPDLASWIVDDGYVHGANTIAIAISIVTCPQMAWAAGGITAPTHEPGLQQGKRPSRAASACGNGIMRARDTPCTQCKRHCCSLLMTAGRSMRSYTANSTISYQRSTANEWCYSWVLKKERRNYSCNGKDWFSSQRWVRQYVYT
jgi:hypothetical protein